MKTDLLLNSIQPVWPLFLASAVEGMLLGSGFMLIYKTVCDYCGGKRIGWKRWVLLFIWADMMGFFNLSRQDGRSLNFPTRETVVGRHSPSLSESCIKPLR
jgi:hypothetical protein